MSLFPSINSFAKMLTYRQFNDDRSKRHFAIKEKLHGTNASILIQAGTEEEIEGRVQFRSKNRVLTLNNDNANFYGMHYNGIEEISRLFGCVKEEVIISGELIGPGIHKGSTDACTMIERRVFCPFSVQIGDEVYADLAHWSRRMAYMGWKPIPILRKIDVDFSPFTDLTELAEDLELLVTQIGRSSQFIRETFGIEGTGEGIVGTLLEYAEPELWWAYAFKAKAEHHRVKQTKLALTTQEPLPHTVHEFVDMMVTAPRILQAVSELGIEFDIRETPNVLKWVANDIIKEGMEELQELGLEWKQVAKHVNGRIVSMWKDMINDQEALYIAGAAAALEG